MTARQLIFDLGREPSFDADEFLVSSCNETAHAAVRAWPSWAGHGLLVLGPAGSGKSHLAAIWGKLAVAAMLDPRALVPKDLRKGQAVIFEDLDRIGGDEVGLFHALNCVHEAEGWLLMTAREPPNRWGLRTPDLISRLRLAPTVSIGHPDAVLIRSVIVKLFQDRQIAIDEDVVAYAARHCEQSLQAANAFVAAVDDEALASGRRITRPLAARMLARDSIRDEPNSGNDRDYGPT